MMSDQSGNSYHVICGHLRAKKNKRCETSSLPEGAVPASRWRSNESSTEQKNIYFNCGTVKTQRGLWIPLKHQRCECSNGCWPCMGTYRGTMGVGGDWVFYQLRFGA